MLPSFSFSPLHGVDGRRLAGLALMLMVAGPVISGCRPAGVQAVSEQRIEIRNGNTLAALDGNTLVLLNRGDKIYFSSGMDTLLRRFEGRNLIRRLVGREVRKEGVFAAVGPDGKEMVGLAAITADHRDRVLGLVLLQTFKGDDRVVDLAARARFYSSISLLGVDKHVSCLVTPWMDSRKRSGEADFRPESCEIRRGRALPGVKVEKL